MIANLQGGVMDKIYLVGAYYPYEGTEPVMAFATKEEATEFMEKANAHHGLRPVYDRSPDYSERLRDWERSHPAGDTNTSCESYEIDEVPFGQRSES